MSAETNHIIILLTFALLSNIPLGYLRQGVTKRSALWFLYIHMSIPFIIILRIHYGISWHFIPATISCALIGQLSGGIIRKRRQQG